MSASSVSSKSAFAGHLPFLCRTPRIVPTFSHIMAKETFCSPCQGMLAMQYFEEEWVNPHHPDAQSFKQALEMGCPLCTRIWLMTGKPDTDGGLEWHLSGRPLGGPGQDLNFEYVKSPYLVASFHAEPWPPAHDAAADVLCDNTGSDRSFQFIAERYRQCRSEHASCSSRSSDSYLPTRLLDVGDHQNGSIRVVESTGIQQHATYITLSHCWGHSVPQKLTASSVAILRQGIADAELPKTFQHAVTVARKMNQRYLWIDSLYVTATPDLARED